ncbi:MAG: EAL domain-containing protein [Agathobacter sp.]|nr:EAL domain-containing protein [Agathobacter sp.]
MKSIFVVLSALVTMLLMVLLYYLIKKEYRYKDSLWVTISIGAITIVVYTGYIISTSNVVAVFLHGMYLACIDWLVLCILLFVLRLMGKDYKSTGYFKILICLSCFDTITLFINGFKNFIFELGYQPYGGYWIRKAHAFMLFHNIYVLMLMLVIIYLLVSCIIRESYVYKVKYIGVLLPFVGVLGISFLSSALNLRVNLSVLCYGICAFFVCYFSNYTMPEVLIRRSLRQLADGIEDAIICFDSSNHKIYQNKWAEYIFGDMGEDSTTETYLRLLFGDEKNWNNENCVLKLDGKLHYYKVDYSNGNSNEFFGGSYIKLKDYTDEEERLRKNHEFNTHDPLTGLYNRNGFFEKVDECVKKYPDSEWVMVCSNIKGFKIVNKLFGEDMGNQILIKEAELIKRFSNDKSVCGRIMDDKFALFFKKEAFNLSLFLKSIEKIQKMVSNSMYSMNIHVGIYEVEDNNELAQLMYDKAKMALDELGEDYQQIFSYYNSKLMDKILSEKNVLSELDNAISTGQYCMYLHPQATPDGNVIGAEGLVRWIHPQNGMVSPAQFIPILESSGLIYKLDRYMWEEAAKVLKRWQKEGKTDYYISVNLSIKDFYYMDIYKEFTSIVEQYGIPPQKLKIEITETVLMMEFDKAIELFKELQEYGFYVEMDDFGSGYSSLNMLKKVKADVLKIDMEFLRGESKPKKNRIILEAIICIAKELNMQVIAEGVETQEQVNMLTELGCDVFQGSYYGYPMPVEEFEQKCM